MSLGRVLYSVQTTLPEAGGQVGLEPAAASWEWFPGAPCSLSARAKPENSCCDRLGTALLGVHLAPRARGSTCLLGTKANHLKWFQGECARNPTSELDNYYFLLLVNIRIC